MPSAWEKIGRLLVQRGLLTEEQFASVQREASAGAATFGEVIVSRGYSDRERLTKTLHSLAGAGLRCPEGCGGIPPQNLDIGWNGLCPKCGAGMETRDPVVSRGTPTSRASAPEAPPEVAAAAKDPKRVLGKYTLVAELGRGGMAVVYKAWDASLQQYVALKLIRTQDLGLSDQPQRPELEAFLREARMAAKLQHPNIVRVFEAGSLEDRHYLSMQYIEGRSLLELLKSSGSAKKSAYHESPRRFL